MRAAVKKNDSTMSLQDAEAAAVVERIVVTRKRFLLDVILTYEAHWC